MKKSFFSFLLTGALCASMLVVSSCKKDDDGLGTSVVKTLDVKVDDGSKYNDLIDEVRLVGYNINTWNAVELVTAKYTAGGFKMDLPESVPANILESFGKESSNVNVSNTNAKLAYNNVSLRAFDKDGNRVGSIAYSKNDKNTNTTVLGELVYADNDVTVTGKVTEEWGAAIYAMSLKKGWNLVFFIEKEVSKGVWEGTATTSGQSGMKWYFEELQ
jgi:hypothetical protein